MNKQSTLLIVSMAVSMSACVGPAEVPQFEEIQPNESAYVIPLEGDTTKQGKFDSVKYLEEKKVAAKRIYKPLRKISTGRMPGSYKWIPTVRIVRVDRAPVTFEWEGTSGVEVESRDSIGFTLGINISGHVAETDTSLFLYRYPSGNISKVLSKIVKSKATEILSREFAKHDLPAARAKKGEIVEIAKSELSTFFIKSGVTITTFGLTGGLTYDDKDIQQAINDNFKSELDIKNKDNDRLAQEKVNAKLLSIAINDKKQALEFAKASQARTQQVRLEIQKMNAEANLIRAKIWKGEYPKNMMPDNSRILYGIDAK